MALMIPILPRTDSGWSIVVPLLIAGCGLGLLVSQLNNYTLSPIEDQRISEAAGVNSAAGSFGLSFGLAMGGGIMLAVLSFSFTHLTEQSQVIPPRQQQQIADTLEDDAEVMSNSQLEPLLTGEPRKVQAEILSIQRKGTRPLSSGGPARARSRQPPRAAQRIPHAAAPRPRALRGSRRGRLGLSSGRPGVSASNRCRLSPYRDEQQSTHTERPREVSGEASLPRPTEA
jgi:hypothetical protein